MTKLVMSIFLIGVGLLQETDILILGLKIGASEKALETISLKVDEKFDDLIKYKTLDNNDFFIALKDGKIVSMENAWLGDSKATKPLYSDFQFGQTSLKDISKKFGSEGYQYKMPDNVVNTDGSTIQLNYFEFDSPNNEVFVTVTKQAQTSHTNEDLPLANYKLIAIIIADKKYLDAQFGTEKIFDKNYKKITAKQ